LTGNWGSKIVLFGPKHPLAVASPGYPPTPKSPEEYKNVWPWRLSFMYLKTVVSQITWKVEN
jgi:hypothetical protein